MNRRFTALVPVAMVAIAMAGCGSSSKKSNTGASTATTPSSSNTQTTGSSSGGGGAGGNDLKLSADPGGNLKFTVSSLTAKAGKVTLTMSNPSMLQHGVSIEGKGVDKDGKVVSQGGVSTVTADLKPGKYTFYCPVPGHRQAGMEGTLTVK